MWSLSEIEDENFVQDGLADGTWQIHYLLHEYWRFEAEFEDGHRNFDNGIGSVYISKKDGTVRGLKPWDMDFTQKFNESSKEIYNYFNK